MELPEGHIKRRFIGGPKDGQSLSVPAALPAVHFAETPRIPLEPLGPDARPIRLPTHTYELQADGTMRYRPPDTGHRVTRNPDGSETHTWDV